MIVQVNIFVGRNPVKNTRNNNTHKKQILWSYSVVSFGTPCWHPSAKHVCRKSIQDWIFIGIFYLLNIYARGILNSTSCFIIQNHDFIVNVPPNDPSQCCSKICLVIKENRRKLGNNCYFIQKTFHLVIPYDLFLQEGNVYLHTYLNRIGGVWHIK